jgi:hypothetical protein
LVRVIEPNAVIFISGDPIFVLLSPLRFDITEAIIIEINVTRVTDSISIEVPLISERCAWAEVLAIWYPISVIILLANIPHPILVNVTLVWVGDERAVIGAIQ